SVGGFWVSGLILFLIATGLPWSTFWGDYFKTMRSVTGTAVVKQDWDGGHAEHEMDGKHDEHRGHGEHAGHGENAEHQQHANGAKPKPSGGPSWRTPVPDLDSYDLTLVNNAAAHASQLDWLPPVLVKPPTDGSTVWTIASDTPNRPHRQTMRWDAASQVMVDHETFAMRHWVDRVVRQGIALHEGQRFGLANQLIALTATVGLVMLSSTGIILWWRRRDQLGHSNRGLSPPASKANSQPREFSRKRFAILAIVTSALAIYLPLFGLSLAAVLMVDRVAMRFLFD
ncbi:PepSY domain-containing protein, partial [Rubripirellula amarantea]|nr:PepSY domain-containing protein [Rubripirellula amarantea]